MTRSDLDIQMAADIITTLVGKIESGEMEASPVIVAQLEGAVMALHSLSSKSDPAEDGPS